MSIKLLQMLLIATSVALASCGGAGEGDEPLPIDEDSPKAYTAEYLAARPRALIQPEHLLIVRLDPARDPNRMVSVRLHIREATTLSISSRTTAVALSHLLLRDPRGVHVGRHAPGDTSVISLEPGAHDLEFHETAGARPQTLYLKLAHTELDPAWRRSPPGLVGAAAPQALNLSEESCEACNFDNSDLTGADLSDQDLDGSTFRHTNISGAHFDRSSCVSCEFNVGNYFYANAPSTTFIDADLRQSHLMGWFRNAKFNGVNMSSSELAGAVLEGCDFRPGARMSLLVGSNLVDASFYNANVNEGLMQYVDFTGAQVGPDTFADLVDVAPGRDYNHGVATMFAHAKLDSIGPSNFLSGRSLAGFDLSGTSFAGADLSAIDLSKNAKVTISAQTDFSKAQLSNGTSGTNFSSQDFGVGYKQFAGSVADVTSGKDLRGVNFAGASLSQADFTRANLTGADLRGADLSYANLYFAALVGAQLGAAPDSGTEVAANLTNAYMPSVDFTDADLRSVAMSGVHAYGQSKFIRARLDSASLGNGAIFADADFTNASMSDADLTKAVLVNVTFSGANLTRTKMGSSYLQGASFASAGSILGLALDNAAVATISGTWPYQESDGTPFVYSYAPTAFGAIQTSAGATVTCPNGSLGPCASAASLVPLANGPYPPAPACIPKPPRYDNCLPPSH
jgi:uncharacterized protein YjbI with pentapeptide repeats